MESDLVFNLLNSEEAKRIEFPGEGNILEFLSFGFSYIEQEDTFVKYVLSNPLMVKRVLVEIPDSELDPDNIRVGKVWTADLLVSKKIRGQRVIFSSADLRTVLVLDKY